MAALQSFVTSSPGWSILIGVVLLGLLALAGLVAYGFSAPPTPEERKKWLPGDNLLGNEANRLRGTLAITIDAPRERVWPYLAQLGQRRAGFYSFDWLERLFTFKIYNTYTIVAEWQDIAPGEYIFYHQNGIGSEVKEVDKGRHIASLSDSRRPSNCQGAFAFVPPFGLKSFAWSWNFILEDAGPGQTRFFTRCDAVFEPYDGLRKGLVAFFLGIPSFVMCKSMLKTIKACAEGRKSQKTPMNTEAKPPVEQPIYVPRKSWLGISDWIVDKIGVRPITWKPVLKIFKLIVAGSKYMDAPIFGPIYKRLMLFTPNEKRYSHGTIYNLNVDVSAQAESVVVPMDLVKDMLRHASYIASSNACICRDANRCSHFPKEVCCLFLSKSGQTIVDHGVGYEISLDDALARVDKAAELGLIGQALFVEVEQFIWGFSNETMGHFIEMCFCCPCCCVGLNLSHNASRDVKQRFTASGWTSVVDANLCAGCGDCVAPCPQAAITITSEEKAIVNQDYCVGCGICKTHCPTGAIHINQTRPMRASVQEYFLEDARLDLKI